MKNPFSDCFKKINGTAQSNPLILADPTALHQRGGLPNANIADNKHLVNEKDAKEVFNVYINKISIKLSMTGNKSAKTLLSIATQVLRQLSVDEKQ